MANYYTVLTPAGLAKVANAQITQSKIAITELVIGDSSGINYAPTGKETSLKNEKWRVPITSVEIDAVNPNWIVVEAIIPANAGGFTLREVALYDADGDMIAIGNYPDTYKPIARDGSTMDLILRTIIEVTNADSVELLIDPSIVTATRQYVDEQVAKGGGGGGFIMTQPIPQSQRTAGIIYGIITDVAPTPIMPDNIRVSPNMAIKKLKS